MNDTELTEQAFQLAQKIFHQGHLNGAGKTIKSDLGIFTDEIMHLIAQRDAARVSSDDGELHLKSQLKQLVKNAIQITRDNPNVIAYELFERCAEDIAEILDEVNTHDAQRDAAIKGRTAKQIWEDEQKANEALAKLPIGTADYELMSGRILGLQRARDIVEGVSHD
jgi:hypothetical protein